MTVLVYNGWDFAKVNAEFRWTTTGASADTFTATETSGRYCHQDLTSVLGSGEYDDFAGRLETRLEALDTAHTYTVSFDSNTLAYTILINADTFSIDFDGNADRVSMAAILGFSADQSAASSHTSDIRPKHVISTTVGAISYRGPHVYFANDWAFEHVSDDGSVYGLQRTTIPEFFDFLVPFEAKEQLWDDFATASVPWTWQSMIEHCGIIEPLLLDDWVNNTSRVCKLRADSLNMRAQFRSDQYIDRMDLPLGVRVLGSL